MGMLAKKFPQRITRIALPGREEKRTLIIAEYPEYIFASTHFSLTPADQLKSIAILRSEAAKHNKPFFVAGDMNFTPESEAGKLLSKYFTLLTDPKQPTFPADAPKEAIDYIALFKNKEADNVVLLRRGVVNEPKASDHRPVYADVRFATRADKLFCSDPYLQNITSSGVSVMYQTNAVVHTWVEYGTDTVKTKTARTLLAGQEPCFDIENKVRIDSLEPGRKYYYRVCAQEVLLNEAYRKILGGTVKTAWHSFTLPSPDTWNFTAVIYNDLHEQDGVMNSLAQILKNNGIKADLTFFNGDCVPEPRDRAHAIERVNVLMLPMFPRSSFAATTRFAIPILPECFRSPIISTAKPMARSRGATPASWCLTAARTNPMIFGFITDLTILQSCVLTRKPFLRKN